MYIVTFYSFKGGTGRTMALVNVGVELAKRGRRVLMVDFDLEAPGLDTFPLGPAETKRLGLIDFVESYREKGETPNVLDFVYKSPLSFEGKGELWVMSSGYQDETFDERFKSIDWQRLYEQEDGFLLFEDLKAQWEQAIQPDYVLIDSRTGHTDIGGICTRQLPTAVVLMFFPNEQNRRGLEVIVEQIREEEKSGSGKKINLHFVLSNVPDLDDEEEILAANIAGLRRTLRFEEPDAVLHHYNSLSLVNQAIFTLDRPKSRLAQEYLSLVNAITRKNLEDEKGAVAFLEEALRNIRNKSYLPDLEENLLTIRRTHRGKSEVLRRLVRIRLRQSKLGDALGIVNEALEIDQEDSELLLIRADLSARAGHIEAAVIDLEHIFRLAEASAFDLVVALRLLRRLKPNYFSVIENSQALERTEVDIELTHELQTAPEMLHKAEVILRKWLDASSEDAEYVFVELILCIIAQGKFDEALETLTGRYGDERQLDIYDTFNYAMAEWGKTKHISPVHMNRVLELHSKREASRSANYYQCLAIAWWVRGDLQKAYQALHTAGALAWSEGESQFSCWSYLYIPPERFQLEVDQMRLMFSGNPMVPEFIDRARSKQVVGNATTLE